MDDSSTKNNHQVCEQSKVYIFNLCGGKIMEAEVIKGIIWSKDFQWKLSRWYYGEMTKWQDDKMEGWRGNNLMKCQFVETAIWLEWHVGKMTIWQYSKLMSQWRDYLRRQKVDEMTSWWKSKWTKWWVGKNNRLKTKKNLG